jgi:hypothetical protein
MNFLKYLNILGNFFGASLPFDVPVYSVVGMNILQAFQHLKKINLSKKKKPGTK